MLFSKFRQLPSFKNKQQVAYSSSLGFKTQQFSNDYISSLCRQNLFKEALQVYDFIKEGTHFQATPSNFTNLVFACSSLKSLKHGQQIHNHIRRTISKPDVILNNHIINMYGKCGSVDHAQEVFDAMPERNVVSWASMIACYAQNHCENEAIGLYMQMSRLGFIPEQFTLGNIVRACANMGHKELGRQIHGHAIKSEHGSHTIVQNALVSMYTKFDCVENAVIVFPRIVMKDMVSWGSVISGLLHLGYELQALSHFKEMVSQGSYIPNEFIFGSVFSACSALLQLEYGKQLHGLSIKNGLETDYFTGCALCDMYAKCGSLDSAKVAFCQIDNPDLVSWNAVIAGFAYGNDANEASFFFSNMRHSDVKPNHITNLCLLCACSSGVYLHLGQQIHSYIIKTGFNLDVQVCNGLLTMYSKCLSFSGALRVFEAINGRQDSVSWNAMMAACIQHNQMDEVFQLMQLMQSSETKFDHDTVGNILSICGKLAILDLGSQLHGYALKFCLQAERTVANGLIDMYAKCGDLDDAHKLFQCMTNSDVISWSSLILGYAQFGNAKKALDLFRVMQHLGIKPNHVTFLGVLSACSRVALVDDALHYYKSMEKEHGIVPTREHCTCMVDVLARTGRLEEALEFIAQMPQEPDIIVWKTLLAACRIHDNVEIGIHAAQKILKSDPSNSSAYTLLCNIYASMGWWDEVMKIRKLMRSRGLRKDPGQSWIVINGRVRIFSVEDHSHLEIDGIYLMLEHLFLQIKDVSYLPSEELTASCSWDGLEKKKIWVH